MTDTLKFPEPNNDNVCCTQSPQVELDAEENRKELLLDAQQDYENLEEQFGPQSLGNHELLDRASLLVHNWEQFVLEHPSCILDKELFKKAYVINDLMADFYQSVGQQE